MKKNSVRKFLAFVLLVASLLGTLTTAFADTPSAGDLLRFIPTVITVSEEKVKVEGYFVNLNDRPVRNFTDFDMDVYLKGDELVTGYFGDINQFTVPAMGTKYQSFTFNGDHDLNVGEYACGDSYYASFSCSFKYAD